LVQYVIIYGCKYSDAFINNAEIFLRIGFWLSLKESNIWGNQNVYTSVTLESVTEYISLFVHANK